MALLLGHPGGTGALPDRPRRALARTAATQPRLLEHEVRKFLRSQAFRPGMEALAPRVVIREYRETGGTLILSVSGTLDLRTAPEFAERMADSVSPRWALVLDLDGLDFMDPAGLSVLLAATDRARQAGCSVSLAPPHGGLLRLFRTAGLENVLPLRSESRGDTAPRVRSRFARIAGRG